MSHVERGAVIEHEEAVVDTQTSRVKGGKLATRLAFFIAGFALSCWAPLVPFVQSRLHADAATLGNILLCLGLGAVIGMPLSGAASSKIGAKPVIVAGSVCLLIALPLLAFLSSPVLIGICLLVFGASIGAIDVAANIHGMEVQNAAGTPLMSSFHGLYSVGGLAGSSGMAALIACGVTPELAACGAAVVILGCIATATPGFFKTNSGSSGVVLAIPKGIVLTIGILVMICFLGEGAMLDWGALLLKQEKHVDVSISGIGYAVFAFAMMAIRLVGDRLVARFGERAIVAYGMAFTAFGIAVATFASSFAVVLSGMFLAGLAVGNVIPALFTLAGRQKVMPVQHAVAAVSICGYLGVLMGPALIGYAAHWIGLIAAFYALSALLLLSLCAMPSLKFEAQSEK
ncbi:MFS transporter [Pseudomonas aeruginosa]|uniref:MFS transporter n=1 Tax=Pseudomonas aeruginosa TaxID=287 RepID=UPI000BB6E97B|nr:MFS transporter [Pseudomonas aeruginosa]MBH4114816.1 MFS transporter [Pseudomonas aeruginosa]PBV25606.1 hypothetical protein CJU32_17660 [Pseudomonas aeruginosa]TEL33401.1 MFS transporter [Pseudomonas aeruginosa]HCF3941574.1 MFS transporter [Pseudomonas aeruginosa]HEK3507686.1 MFS transporter [Pseudomonas aeruginosa]